MQISLNRSPSGEAKLLRIMKLTAIFLFAACLYVNAKGHAQSITLSMKNVALEKVFDEINKQTGYYFVYTSDVTQKRESITINVRNATLEQTLHQCLAGLPYSFVIRETTVVIRMKTDKAENDRHLSVSLIDIKGQVTNEKGEPVEDVTVTIKGTDVSTFTNANGEFAISGIDSEAVLVFTHVAMETFELRVNGKTELLISLKTKISELGNVQVVANTGYQFVKPNEVNGAIVVIDNKTLNQQPGINILKRLDGVAPGVLFDTKPLQAQKRSNITVRGLSSINGPLDPLIVLDGFIYEGDINNINPNIIDNVTILKDAAAASIWGARAGNGVIVITTKKGNLNQKLRVDVNANVIISSKPDLYYLPQMSSSDYINVEQFLYNKGFFNGQFTNTNRPPLTPAVEIFRKRSLGQISRADSAAQIDALKNVDIRDQYNKYFLANPLIQKYNISLSGGGNNNAYIISVGYDRSLKESFSQYNKLNAKVENIYKPTKNVQASVSLLYTNSEAKTGRPAYNSITINGRQAPYLSFADSNGNALPVALSLRDLYTDTAGAGKLLNWKYYPKEDYKHDKTTTQLQEYIANIVLQYKPFRFLSFDLKYQFQRQQIEGIQLQDLESYGARNIINIFSQLNRSTGIVKYIVPLGGVRTTNLGNIESQNGRAQMNFNHSWKRNNISAIFGGEIRQVHGWSSRITNYGYYADPLSYGNVDFLTSYPKFTAGSQTIPLPPFYSNIVNRFVSLYTNMAYTFKKNYNISFSARKDGSNIFGVNTNDKWKPLWSAGIGWNVSNEKFYRSRLIPALRFRATYGYRGNVDLSKSGLPVAAYIGNNSLTNFPTARISTINNPDLRWEKVRSLNLGIDFSLKQELIRGSIDYYRNNGIDLYGPTPYDYTTWGNLPTITRNVANMEGKGIEINLYSRNIDKKIQWTTNIIFNYQSNKTTKYFSSTANQVSFLLSGGNQITPVVGKPLYSIAAYKWGGLDTSGNPQGFLNGQLSTNYSGMASEANIKGVNGNIIYIGSALPEMFGNLINTFSFKNISLSVSISYKFKYYFKKSSLSYLSLINNGIGHKEYANRWQNPGDETFTTIPSLIYPNPSGRDVFYASSEINVFRGDHLRLQYLNLSYVINKKSLGKAPFKDLQVNLIASDLGILWKANKAGLDPEYPSSIQPLKSWTFGIRTSF